MLRHECWCWGCELVEQKCIQGSSLRCLPPCVDWWTAFSAALNMHNFLDFHRWGGCNKWFHRLANFLDSSNVLIGCWLIWSFPLMSGHECACHMCINGHQSMNFIPYECIYWFGRWFSKLLSLCLVERLITKVLAAGFVSFKCLALVKCVLVGQLMFNSLLLNVIGQAIYPHTVAAWLIPCCCCPPHWRALLFTRCCWLTIVHYVWCLWLLSSLLTLIDCAMIDSDLCTHSLCKMPAYRCLPCADVCVR